jgi:ornithine cyclodeaminase/alanine dehydrogenase
MVGNKIVVDVLEQCVKVGEIHHALKSNLIETRDVHAELGEIIAGNCPGRTSTDEITIFDTTGTALQDVAAAIFVYEKALKEGIGLYVNLSENDL